MDFSQRMSPDLELLPASKQVMVVEDDVMIRALLAEELRQAGLRVIEAANADEAFAYLETLGPVDLLFTDVRMPGTMTGVDLARRVRGSYPSIHIILTSGNARPAADFPAAFLPKPYDFDRAVAVVLETLGLDRPESQ
jgi:CheY-like chemotaxis protein